MTNCSKCNGLLVRDYNVELETHTKPSYRCVNCSKRIDMRTEINAKLTPEERAALEERPKGRPIHSIPLCLLNLC
jgi:DNA-directed RNA polymerase subunit RPC12/RpoP